MARQMKSTLSNELLTTPPPIVGTEVSARWKRTWKGEVIMTVIMPNDVVDTEVYVKTSKGHIGIQMDPWMSCSWKRNWSLTHTPNTQTKEKMRKFRMQKEGRRISLFKTSGRPRQMRNGHWSPRPEARCHTPHPYRRTPSPTKQAARYSRPSPPSSAQMTKKTVRGDWSDESSTDSAPETAAYHKESTVPGKIQSTLLSPESPPNYERGLSNLDYVPKSPVYYPAGYSDGDSDKDSLIDLNEENWDDDHSATGQKTPTPPEEETTLKDTSTEQAERSPSPPSYKIGDRIGNIYLDSDEVLLKRLTKIADTVNPVNPANPMNPVAELDCWKKRRMFNSYKRLDMAYKLNQWPKKDEQDKPTEATGMDTMQEDDQSAQSTTGDKGTPLTIPVEPMTSPPDIIHPIPSTSSNQSPDVPANFATKLNKVAKIRTGPLCYKAKLVNAMTTKPRVILQRLPIKDLKIHSATI